MALKSDEDITKAVVRMVESLGQRCATGDPDSAALLQSVDEALSRARVNAVAGWRALGFSDSQIGHELGVSKQAVQQRWPQ